MDNTLAPFLLASRSASSVSAVSPDWLIAMKSVFSSTKGSLYLNSEATSTSTGIFTNFSKIFLPTSPAWYAVPHATMQILLNLAKSSLVSVISYSETLPSSLRLRSRVSSIALGWSNISLSMKCSYLPFSATLSSQLMCIVSRLISLPDSS